MTRRDTRAVVRQPASPGNAVLWLGLAAGPLIWFAHLGLTYFLATLHCVSGLGHEELWLNGVTLLALLGVGAAGWGSWRAWQASQAPRAAERDVVVERAAFMALAGVLFCALFAVVILVGDLGAFMLEACG